MRAVLAALALLPTPALAQAYIPCPQMSFGWTTQWQGGTLQSAAYDQAAKVLYVASFTQVVAAFSGVPLSTFQSFTRARNPYQFYTTSIVPAYHQLLVYEKDNCPVLLENGLYLWID